MADPSPDFGPFIIIQVAVAVAVAIGTAIFAWKGLLNKPDERDNRRERGSDRDGDWMRRGGDLYFNGPMIKALETFQEVGHTLDEARREAGDHCDRTVHAIDELVALQRQTNAFLVELIAILKELRQGQREKSGDPFRRRPTR